MNDGNGYEHVDWYKSTPFYYLALYFSQSGFLWVFFLKYLLKTFGFVHGFSLHIELYKHFPLVCIVNVHSERDVFKNCQIFLRVFSVT